MRVLGVDPGLTRCGVGVVEGSVGRPLRLVAVERVFSQHNVRTVMGTAQASAVAVLAGARLGLPVQTYTPSEVKAAVTGSGTAGKAQVTAMVTRLLQLDEPPKPADAADALALAICHIWRGGTRARIQAAAVAAAQRAHRGRVRR